MATNDPLEEMFAPAELPDATAVEGESMKDLVLTSTAANQATYNNAQTGAANYQNTGVQGKASGNVIVDAIVGGVQILQQQQAADAQADSLRKAAKNLYTEAAQTMRQGEYVAMVRGLDLEQRLGALKVAATAAGVDANSGSAATAQRMTQTFGRMDVAMERLNAARRAKGLREQAKELQKQADFTEEQSFLGTTDIFGPFA